MTEDQATDSDQVDPREGYPEDKPTTTNNALDVLFTLETQCAQAYGEMIEGMQNILGRYSTTCSGLFELARQEHGMELTPQGEQFAQMMASRKEQEEHMRKAMEEQMAQASPTGGLTSANDSDGIEDSNNDESPAA